LTEPDETADLLATPKVQLMGTYPPKAKEPQGPIDQPEIAPIDPDLAKTEARTKCLQAYFSVAIHFRWLISFSRLLLVRLLFHTHPEVIV
jgi:hypothetical protein